MKHAAPPKHELETKLEVTRYLPRLWLVCLCAALVVVGGLIVWPLAAASHRTGWTGGAVTNHHRLIEASCVQCHRKSFASVADDACTACHQVRLHSEKLPAIVSAHPQLAVRCVSCHREHHGKANLVPAESIVCTGCHDQLKSLQPTHALPTFSNLASHAEFAIEAWTGDPPQLTRVTVTTPSLRATTQLKFSHALHLSLTPDDEPALTCKSCHEASDDDLRPVAFRVHCERCHAQTFEDGELSFDVPHAAPDQVFRLVRGELARRQWATRADKNAAPLTASAERDAEASLFTEGGTCLQCHDVHVVDNAAEDASHFRVDPPQQARVLTGARFTHESHRLTPCDGCHRDIRESRSTAAVLLPSINLCRECHADPGVPAKVSSPCLQCHRYHGGREPARP